MALTGVYIELIVILFLEFGFLLLLFVKAARLNRWEFEIKAEESALKHKQKRFQEKLEKLTR